jgi:hypothetical protein
MNQNPQECHQKAFLRMLAWKRIGLQALMKGEKPLVPLE